MTDAECKDLTESCNEMLCDFIPHACKRTCGLCGNHIFYFISKCNYDSQLMILRVYVCLFTLQMMIVKTIYRVNMVVPWVDFGIVRTGPNMAIAIGIG